MADSQLPDLSPEALDRLPAEGLLGLLTGLQREVTRDLIDVCVARQAEMAPLLQAFVEDDSTWDPEASDGVWWGIVHAVFVLGQMQGAEAAAGLVGALRRMDDATADAPWDWLDGYWPAQFRGKREHARAALRALALDSAANHQARSIACDCLLADAQEQGGEALESTLDWLVDRVGDPDENPDLRGGLGSSLLSFPRPRHREALESAGREAPGSVFPYFVLDDVLKAYRKASPPEWQTHFADPLSFYASEALDAYRARRKSQGSAPVPTMVERTPAPSRTPAQRGVTVAPRADRRKIGRNEPCPCGSGKKYKKCCGR
jgi:hypothetical protein